MSTDIIEQMERQDSQLGVQREFIAPKVRVGQEVAWYDHGDKNGVALTAVVVKTMFQTVKVRITDRARQNEVMPCRHINDPWLDENPTHRIRNGAWDYTDEYREQESRRKMIQTKLELYERKLEAHERRLEMLERALGKKLPAAPKDEFDRMSDTELRAALSELGADVRAEWDRPRLLKELRDI